MANPVKRVPEGYHTVTPHLVVRGATQAIAFYQKAFGARQLHCHLGPSGKGMHAERQLGDSRIFLNDEFPERGATSPQALNGTPVTIHLAVEDVDSVFNRAVQAGAQVVMPVADQFWGDRYGMVADPFGHRWSMASHVRDVSPEELQKAAAAAFGAGH